MIGNPYDVCFEWCASLRLRLRAAVLCCAVQPQSISVLFLFSLNCLFVHSHFATLTLRFLLLLLLSTGEYGIRENKRIRIISSSEDPSRPSDLTESNFTVERGDVDRLWAGQGIMYLVGADGETIVDFFQLVDGQTYWAVSKSDAPERRFAVLDEQLEISAALRLHTHVLQQHPGAHIHHNVKVYRSGQELAQFDAVVHVDGAGGSFVFVMEAKSRVHPTDPLAVLEKFDKFKRCLTMTDLSFTEGFDPKPNILQFSTHFARDSKMMIPYLAGTHFTPELVKSCQRLGVNAIYHSGDEFDLALA
jgi:hypothetical protein